MEKCNSTWGPCDACPLQQEKLLSWSHRAQACSWDSAPTHCQLSLDEASPRRGPL